MRVRYVTCQKSDYGRHIPYIGASFHPRCAVTPEVIAFVSLSNHLAKITIFQGSRIHVLLGRYFQNLKNCKLDSCLKKLKVELY